MVGRYDASIWPPTTTRRSTHSLEPAFLSASTSWTTLLPFPLLLQNSQWTGSGAVLSTACRKRWWLSQFATDTASSIIFCFDLVESASVLAIGQLAAAPSHEQQEKHFDMSLNTCTETEVGASQISVFSFIHIISSWLTLYARLTLHLHPCSLLRSMERRFS